MVLTNLRAFSKGLCILAQCTLRSCECFCEVNPGFRSLKQPVPCHSNSNARNHYDISSFYDYTLKLCYVTTNCFHLGFHWHFFCQRCSQGCMGMGEHLPYHQIFVSGPTIKKLRLTSDSWQHTTILLH